MHAMRVGKCEGGEKDQLDARKSSPDRDSHVFSPHSPRVSRAVLPANHARSRDYVQYIALRTHNATVPLLYTYIIPLTDAVSSPSPSKPSERQKHVVNIILEDAIAGGKLGRCPSSTPYGFVDAWRGAMKNSQMAPGVKERDRVRGRQEDEPPCLVFGIPLNGSMFFVGLAGQGQCAPCPCGHRRRV